MKRLLRGMIFSGILLVSSTLASAENFQPFWDFRYWPNRNIPIYQKYMDKFVQHRITAMILINANSLPPFSRERQFLADAARRGVKVWIRTNRVSPKRGIPDRPNSTLDFALDPAIQKETLEYLLALAALSKEYPNLTGLVIGGEEFVGQKTNEAVLPRHQPLGLRELGFSLTDNLSEAQKIRYFDWLEERNNQWYEKIWDTIKERYPKMELFIYPSEVAICGGRYSKFPRPAYWDIHDLIVNRKKYFHVIVGCYTIREDYLGSEQAAATGIYLRAATEDKVPYYLLLQAHRTKGSPRTPTPEELESQVMAAIDSGVRGVGYWPTDADTLQDISETDPRRWQAIFQAIARGAQYFSQPRPQGSGLYVVKPRYSQYWERDDGQTIKTLAALWRAGLNPEFLLVEQILTQALPAQAKVYYLPETFKYESPQVLQKLQASGKPIFFGLGAAEPFTPDKKPLPSLYDPLDIKKASPAGKIVSPETREFTASWVGKSYQLVASPFLWPRWQYPKKLVMVTGPDKGLPLVFSNGRLIFLSISDYSLLISADKTNQNEEFIKRLLTQFLNPRN
jgi:hypothetical protein